jgi:TolA-binding protein
MNDDRSTTRQSFFSRVFAGTTEGEGTAIYSAEEVGTGTSGMREQEGAAHGFTVERAAEVIKNLPPEVPRLSAVRIVRGTLEAAGIDIAELESSTRARESRLNSEIDLSESRIQHLKDETEEVIRNLEDEIRKAREARNFGVSEEERKIQAAETGLDNIDLVREFFGLPQEEDEPPADPAADPAAESAGEETQIMDGMEEEEGDETQVLRRPGPLSDSEDYWEAGDKKEP